jgi:cytochrome c-type biogenesis protein CcmH
MELTEDMKRFAITGTFTCLVVMLLWTAVCPAADTPQNAKLEREIEDNLIAPCCWTQPVSQHPSEVSEKIRKEVKDMVAAGKSRDEILDYYVAQYGERSLASPRWKVAYILPWLALALGGLLLIILLKKLRKPAPAPAPAPVPDARYTSAVEQEMKDLE